MSIELIVGPISSGKNKALFEELLLRQEHGYRVVLFEPNISIRDKNDELNKFLRARLRYDLDFYKQVKKTFAFQRPYKRVIGVNDAMFFKDSIIKDFQKLSKRENIDIIAATIDRDYLGGWFKFQDSKRTVENLLNIAHKKEFKTAKCAYKSVLEQDGVRVEYTCDKIGVYSQRLKESDRYILIGKEFYEPRCREHFKSYAKIKTKN